MALHKAFPRQAVEAKERCWAHGRGAPKVKLRDIGLPTPRWEHGKGTMEELLQCNRGAPARKAGRTLTAIRDRLGKAPWSNQLATEFCGTLDHLRKGWARETFPGVLSLAEHCLRLGRHGLLDGFLNQGGLDETLGSVVAQLNAVAVAEDRKAREARRQTFRARLGDSGAGFTLACRMLAGPRHPPIATLRAAQGGYTTKAA